VGLADRDIDRWNRLSDAGKADVEAALPRVRVFT
jgi:hypothetical protein